MFLDAKQTFSKAVDARKDANRTVSRRASSIAMAVVDLIVAVLLRLHTGLLLRPTFATHLFDEVRVFTGFKKATTWLRNLACQINEQKIISVSTESIICRLHYAIQVKISSNKDRFSSTLSRASGIERSAKRLAKKRSGTEEKMSSYVASTAGGKSSIL